MQEEHNKMDINPQKEAIDSCRKNESEKTEQVHELFKKCMEDKGFKKPEHNHKQHQQ